MKATRSARIEMGMTTMVETRSIAEGTATTLAEATEEDRTTREGETTAGDTAPSMDTKNIAIIGKGVS